MLDIPSLTITIYVRPSDRDRLRSLAKKQGCSMAEMVHRMLDSWLGDGPNHDSISASQHLNHTKGESQSYG